MHQVTKVWEFQLQYQCPSNEYSGLISFRIDWFHLLTVQGTLKSLLQHNSSKASILWRSALFIVQLSHPYMTTGKSIVLPVWTFVSKVTSLLFNMLSRRRIGVLFFLSLVLHTCVPRVGALQLDIFSFSLYVCFPLHLDHFTRCCISQTHTVLALWVSWDKRIFHRCEVNTDWAEPWSSDRCCLCWLVNSH